MTDTFFSRGTDAARVRVLLTMIPNGDWRKRGVAEVYFAIAHQDPRADLVWLQWQRKLLRLRSCTSGWSSIRGTGGLVLTWPLTRPRVWKHATAL